MRSELCDLLNYCTNLPSLPGAALKVLELGQDPDVNPSALANVIGHDPALTSRILRVSNSPLYAQHRKSDNLQQAIMALGLNATMTLALSFSLVETMRDGGKRPEMIDRIWRRALIAGEASRAIARLLRIPRQEEAFLAAMLQDIGVLALNAAVSEQYQPLLVLAQSHDELLAREREQLDSDHGEAGAWLMRHWGLPVLLADAAQASHEPDAIAEDEPNRRFLLTVALASRMADMFISCRRQEDADRLVDQAHRWLGMEQDLLQQAFTEVAEALPEVERIFEARLVSGQQIAAVMEQARELLAMRNLQLIQQAAEHQRRVREMEKASRHWQEEAIRDPLTGLHNRRFFDERLEQEFMFATEHGMPLVLGFMDLDHFKDVNDQYGHDMGDQVLSQVAETLRRHTRETDVVVRYGGEEFVILLPGTRLTAAHLIFDRLRCAIEAERYTTVDGHTIGITVSIGIAAHMDTLPAEQSQLDLVRNADRALYSAKKHGRNRVECAVAELG